VVAVPAPGVVQAIRDCGTAGIPFAVVLTAGFRESGAEGRKLEEELKRVLAETGVRIVGPNCQGMLSVDAGCGPRSAASPTRPSSSPAACRAPSSPAASATPSSTLPRRRAWASAIASPRQRGRHHHPELLSAFLDDPGTSLAFAYLEGTPDARRLLDLGRKSLETASPC
jgi:acetyltransferase